MERRVWARSLEFLASVLAIAACPTHCVAQRQVAGLLEDGPKVRSTEEMSAWSKRLDAAMALEPAVTWWDAAERRLSAESLRVDVRYVIARRAMVRLDAPSMVRFASLVEKWESEATRELRAPSGELKGWGDLLACARVEIERPEWVGWSLSPELGIRAARAAAFERGGSRLARGSFLSKVLLRPVVTGEIRSANAREILIEDSASMSVDEDIADSLEENDVRALRNVLMAAPDDCSSFPWGVLGALANRGDAMVRPRLEQLRKSLPANEVSDCTRSIRAALFRVDVQASEAGACQYLKSVDNWKDAYGRIWTLERAVKKGYSKAALRQALFEHRSSVEKAHPDELRAVRGFLGLVKARAVDLLVFAPDDWPDVHLPPKEGVPRR